jgi:hypothetical protein
MTKEEALKIMDGLTQEQKIILYRLLSCLAQSPSPAEPERAAD